MLYWTDYQYTARTLPVAGGAATAGITVDYQAKKSALEAELARRFDELGAPEKTIRVL